jgi:phenylacetate-CoA ligase
VKNASTSSKLDALVQHVWATNPFYQRAWRTAGLREADQASACFNRFPVITRAQLLHDQHSAPPLGTNLGCAFQQLRRFHRSSGTSGANISWADTTETWDWVMHCSRELFGIAGVSNDDRALAALPFGASSGSWIIYEGLVSLGVACLTAGNSSLEDQHEMMLRHKPNVLIGKADALLRMGEMVAGHVPVSKLILTGQNSFGAIRKDLKRVWNAECFDRYGMTEAGSIASECTAHSGCLHILNDEFFVECLDESNDERVPDGEAGEVVITNFGRKCRPLIRYRTHDRSILIRDYKCACGRTGDVLMGGVNRITS